MNAKQEIMKQHEEIVNEIDKVMEDKEISTLSEMDRLVMAMNTVFGIRLANLELEVHGMNAIILQYEAKNK